MPAKESAGKSKGATPHKHFHKDGSLWARGQLLDGVPHGYWEWFRKDGSKMRTGHFERGAQVGEWSTCAADGRLVKATKMKLKPGA